MPVKHGLKPTPVHPKDATFAFHKVFGAVQTFPESYDADAGLTSPDQNLDRRPTGCTSYTVCDIGTDQDGILYSHDYQLSRTFELMRVPPDTEGADARTAFKVAVAFGLLPKDLELPAIALMPQFKAADGVNWPAGYDLKAVKKPAYLPIQKTTDHFDAIRSALLLGQGEHRTIGMATRWSPEFSGKILPDNPSSLYWGHMYKVRGWETINGQPYLKLKTWEGDVTRYMSRTLCNKLMGEWGAYAATLRDVPTGELSELIAKRVTILEALIALLQNLLQQRWTS